MKQPAAILVLPVFYQNLQVSAILVQILVNCCAEIERKLKEEIERKLKEEILVSQYLPEFSSILHFCMTEQVTIVQLIS